MPEQDDIRIETEHPVWDLLRVAAPSVATTTSYTLMQFVDGLMVARVEPSSLSVSAQGNGGVWAWAPMSIGVGFLGMINTFVSQNLGAGKPERGPAYAWTGLWLSLAYWLLLVVPYGLMMPTLFGMQNHSAELVRLESAYAQILLLGGLFTLSSRAVSQFFYGLHQPMVVLIAALVGNVTNLTLNWALIFGHLGFPAMGVHGAAIATVIGTAVEFLIPLCIFLGPRMNARYRTRAAWRWSIDHTKDLLRTGWSPALMFGNEMICWAYFMTALAGRFGETQNAASWAVLRYMHMSFMPAAGISMALTAIVGKCLGAGRPDLAQQRAWLGIRIAMGYMIFCATVMIVFRGQLVSVFTSDKTNAAELAAIIATGGKIMIVAAIFQAFDGLGITIIGCLRGAGDTVLPSIVTMFLAWIFILGLGWTLATYQPAWGALGPWVGAAAYIVVLGIFLFFRFQSGRWKSMKLLQESATNH